MCESVYAPDQDIPAHVHPWAVVLQTAADALPALDRLRYTLRSAPTWLVFQLRAEFALHDDLSAASVQSSVFALLADLSERPGLSLRGSPPVWLESVRERIHDEFRQAHSRRRTAADSRMSDVLPRS